MNLKLALAWILPGATRYFVVSKEPVDRIASGVATVIRKKGRSWSYLYLQGNPDDMWDRRSIELVPDTEFFWGPWADIDMRRGVPVCREIDELEAFVMIRQAASPVPAIRLIKR